MTDRNVLHADITDRNVVNVDMTDRNVVNEIDRRAPTHPPTHLFGALELAANTGNIDGAADAGG